MTTAQQPSAKAQIASASNAASTPVPCHSAARQTLCTASTSPSVDETMSANLARGMPSQSSKDRESSASQWSSPSAAVGSAQFDGLSRHSRYNVIMPISPPVVRPGN
ncbi:hypothetical protein [Streptomyces sp. CBMA152]|uniref:hypothetical protein n=1 Tax=Streptomyces sp. CBMA152 TaxID=1896312 RepID=UPI0016612574|nr:hypothetical protein [Streptomyces sp. CBMA152]